jgi:hypothetical protein
MYGVERLVIAPATFDDWRSLSWNAIQEWNQSLLHALDKNCTIQNFEITGYPFWKNHHGWFYREIHIKSFLRRNTFISSLIASSPEEIPPIFRLCHMCSVVLCKSLCFKPHSFTKHSKL